MTLDEVLKSHVLKTLSESESKAEAAKKLKISIRTLRNYLNEWGLRDLMGKNPRRDPLYFHNPTFEEREKMQNWDGLWRRTPRKKV